MLTGFSGSHSASPGSRPEDCPLLGTSPVLPSPQTDTEHIVPGTRGLVGGIPPAWLLSPAALPKPGAATGRPPASQPRPWWGGLHTPQLPYPMRAGLGFARHEAGLGHSPLPSVLSSITKNRNGGLIALPTQKKILRATHSNFPLKSHLLSHWPKTFPLLVTSEQFSCAVLTSPNTGSPNKTLFIKFNPEAEIPHPHPQEELELGLESQWYSFQNAYVGPEPMI